ncbi:MAG TPA: GH92 family glycosyl hydrolase, partial [Bacteroidales bacterium]
ERERSVDLINAMLDRYKHDGLLPVWELAANETNCMIGYHAVPVIVDAYRKGIRGFDANLALEAMKASANANQFGLEEYRNKGYIPADKEGESISRTLEYAYDDWCIAEMARMLGDEDIYREFTERAQYFKNLYDKESGFFRGKSNGSFVEPFDPTQVNFMLTEANTWQYNFFVPQDIITHIEMLGGDEAYAKKLDELFTTNAELTGRVQSDITGLIGQYAHGNEPSHNMAYLYNYAGEPWKTQKIALQIMNKLYSDQPDGLSGNEDCGQMSAWYVMSAMGFYPVTPGSNVYVLGTPLFDSLEIKLENGNIFKVQALNLGKENFYVQSVNWKGKEYGKSFITNEMIMEGGELVFNMGSSPSDFGVSPENRPFQKITDNLITPVPYFSEADRTFEKNLTIALADLDADAEIRWGFATEEDEPVLRKYSAPVEINKTSSLKAVAHANGKNSFFEEAVYYKIPEGRSVTVVFPYNDQYTAGGDKALINTLRGGDDFRTGNWQGYYGVDLDATLDLGKMQKINEVGAGFLQSQRSWIFMPAEVSFEISKDGKSWKPVGTDINDVDPKEGGGITKDFVVDKINDNAQFVRVKAKNIGVCPAWHVGAGEKAWIFVDEIWVK